MNMLAKKLDPILNELNSSSSDIEASAVLTTDGLTINSLLSDGMDSDKVSAMSAALLSLGTRTTEYLGRGTLEQLLIKGELGYVLITPASSDKIVTVLTKAEARLGLIFLDVKRATDAIKKIEAQ